MGRALKLHSNPRRPAENRIQAWAPSFNRAVLFETNEHSWHGFPTRDRPAGELAPVHGTFYVHRPLPARFREGYTLTEADEEELLFQMDRRDIGSALLFHDRRVCNGRLKVRRKTDQADDYHVHQEQ